MLRRIETARLVLRPFQPDDADVAFRWLGDPRVMQYTPSGPDDTIERTRRRIAGYRAHDQRYGYSKWAIVERESGAAIGDSGLSVLETQGWTDLGFRLAPDWWGNGLATEVASAWVHAAFHDFGLRTLGAFSHVENVASLRVLEKVGFKALRRDMVMQMPSVVFSLTAPAPDFST